MTTPKFAPGSHAWTIREGFPTRVRIDGYGSRPEGTIYACRYDDGAVETLPEERLFTEEQGADQSREVAA